MLCVIRDSSAFAARDESVGQQRLLIAFNVHVLEPRRSSIL
jgi:hypothetical protein